jgi:N6-L-threonylcarbamoyladenine synthase
MEPLILGIESSCDETAAALVRGDHVLSNVIATQHDLHAKYAGVVPEVASRAHIERILPVIREAMQQANVRYEQLDAVGVGHRPGLIGSLLVGVSAAKALAWSLGKPVIGVDHIHAHLHSGLLDAPPVEYPALGLVVSGGHTSLFLVRSPLDVMLLGRTIDDAVGEAYDKAAAILSLGYPGGPKLDALAQRGNDRAHDFPIAMLDKESLDFSFSGLKTSLLYAVKGYPGSPSRESGRDDQEKLSRLGEQGYPEKADFAASFQRAAVEAIMRKLRRALKRHPARTLLTGGGVTANSRLRRELLELGEAQQIDVRLPRAEYCLDNAAMIGALAAHRFAAGRFDDLSLSASPRSAIR